MVRMENRMVREDYAAKADEMRRRADDAQTDGLRALYRHSAESYELAARARNGRSDDLASEVEALTVRVTALENALTTSLSMLRRQVPGFAASLGQVNVEAHPDAPEARKPALRAIAERVRKLLGRPAGPNGTTGGEPPV
jgi:hypothetical protein